MLAYLRAEPGGNVVSALLSDPKEICYAHTVNLIEVYYDFARRTTAHGARQALSVLREDGVIERRTLHKRFAEL